MTTPTTEVPSAHPPAGTTGAHLALAAERIDEYEAAGGPPRLVAILRTFAAALAAGPPNSA